MTGKRGAAGRLVGWLRLSQAEREWLLVASVASVALLWNVGPYAS